MLMPTASRNPGVSSLEIRLAKQGLWTINVIQNAGKVRMNSGKIMLGFSQVGKDTSVLVCYASGVLVAGWHSKCNRAVRRASRAICKRQGSKTREQGKVTGQGRARKQSGEEAKVSDPTIAGSEHWQKAFGNLLTKSEQWQTSICKLATQFANKCKEPNTRPKSANVSQEPEDCIDFMGYI